MNKTKLLSAILCAVILLSSVIMTGCGQKENNETDAANTNSTRKTETLNMFVITNDSTDPDAARAVQMAINEVTLPKYKTTIKINYIKADEYWATIEATEAEVTAYTEEQKAIKEAEEAAKKEAQKNMTAEEKRKADREAKKAADEAEKAAAEGKTVDGVSEEDLAAEFTDLVEEIYETDDITLEAPQLDIFIVDGPDMLKKLIEEERIKSIDSYLSVESKILKSYIYPTFLATAKINGQTWGVPTNGALGGTYEYYVYDKALLDKYNYKMDDLLEVREMKSYLETIKQSEPDFAPLCDNVFLSGWEFYGDEGSVMGTYKKDTSTGWDTDIHPIFDDLRYFYRYSLAVQDYKNSGYFASNYPTGTKLAIDLRTSDVRPPESFTEDGREYVTYIYKLPRATIDDALKCTWAISALSTRTDRAMEMITLFNTDPVLANLLQYGIKGVNYYYNEDEDVVEPINDKYSMNTEFTGNTYIKYASGDEKEFIEKAKAKNLDTVPYAFIGFDPGLEDEDLQILAKANEVSKHYYNLMKSGELTVDEAFAQGKAALDEIDGFSGVASTIASKYAGYVGSVASSFATPPIVLDRIKKNKESGVEEEIPETSVAVGVEEEPAIGEAVEGEVTEGEAVEGEVTEGEVAEGEATQGEATDGATAEGEAVATEDTTEAE